MTGALPLVGLAGLLLFLPFGIAGQQISLAVGLAGVLLHRPARRRVTSLFANGGPGRPLLFGTAAWIAASLVALILSGEIAGGARELRKLPLLLALVLPVGAIRSRRDLQAATVLLLLAGAAAAAAGIFEQLRGAGNHPTRLDGPIGFYMTSAGVFLLIGMAALGVAVERPRLGSLPASALIILTGALVLTYTRGAWFGWAAGAAFLLVRRRPVLFAPALVLFGSLLFAFPGTRERFLTSWDLTYDSNRERAWLIEAGWRAFADHRWTGAGLHDLARLIDEYRNAGARDRLTHFHSIYLQTAVAMGIIGLAALAALIVSFFRALLAAAGRTADRAGRGIVEGALAALFAFLVHGMFEWNLGDSEVATTLYTILGLALAAGAVGRARSGRDESRR